MKLRQKFDELAMLELFYAEPVIANPADGYWCYEVTDALGIKLRFGMDVIQESVQINLKLADVSIFNFTFEMVEDMEILDPDKGKFAFEVAAKNQEVKTKIQVELRPYIRIEGATLRGFY
ncbi:hypothetical protein NIES2119_08435 [[Phormidium ambiguum] IAM M-71]|uniref:Uncharacterized protein n=1 Tax=[Phormidium ambiguum] IAM M-71 TaxID=454136 RepID=A0A1U7IMR2_9CYAN|nr:hypothetical protein [Phormidium ambiguum]OKH38617.1 hypothetical protein NIES2119_08435 [Phormidium ambiguum IAM M-71]